jgi:hypothetical protein
MHEALLTFLIRRCLEDEAGVVLLWRKRQFGRWLGVAAQNKKPQKVFKFVSSSTHVNGDACGELAARESTG